jgi:hypothetical protein
MNTRVCALVLTSLLPLPSLAIAQCATRADMATGVRVTFDNGDTTELRARDGDLVEVTERYSWESQSLIYEADYGLYSRHEITLSAGGARIPESETSFAYDADLPVPHAAAAPWHGLREVREYGMGTKREEWEVGFRAMDPVEIGACTYDAVAVGIRLRGGADDEKIQFSYYLPELMAGFIVSWVDEGVRHDTVPVQIEALR